MSYLAWVCGRFDLSEVMADLEMDSVGSLAIQDFSWTACFLEAFLDAQGANSVRLVWVKIYLLGGPCWLLVDGR